MNKCDISQRLEVQFRDDNFKPSGPPAKKTANGHMLQVTATEHDLTFQVFYSNGQHAWISLPNLPAVTDKLSDLIETARRERGSGREGE